MPKIAFSCKTRYAPQLFLVKTHFAPAVVVTRTCDGTRLHFLTVGVQEEAVKKELNEDSLVYFVSVFAVFEVLY